VTLIVAGTTASQLSVTPATESFALVQGGQPIQEQVTVSNLGGGILQFSAQASSDANWLTLTGSSSGMATPSLAASVAVMVNPGANLTVGLHRGQITVTDTGSGKQATATLTLLVNGAQQTVQLSQSGFTFTAVANVATLQPQSFSVFNLGQGSMAWTAEAQTIPPGQTWLVVSPSGGTSAPGAPGQAMVSVNHAGMPPGQYYGTVKVSAPSAANILQSVSVLLNVVQAGQLGSAPAVSTAGVILTGVEGGSTAVQQVSLFNPTGVGLSYSAGAFTDDGSNWLTVNPAAGSLSQTGTGALAIQASLAGVTTGVRYGTVQVAFSEGTVHTIGVALVATSSGTAGAIGMGDAKVSLNSPSVQAASGCEPKMLVPEFQKPERSQNVQVAQPQTLQVQVADDCGNSLTSKNGAVKVVFSNKDAAVDLSDEGGGIWKGTWNPVTAQAHVTLDVDAFKVSANGSVLAGSNSITGVEILPPNANAAAQPIGALNAASLDRSNVGTVVPGSYVAIYGARLADVTAQPNRLPLPLSLGNAQLRLGDQPLPLSFASPTQVNGLIPQSLAVNTALQLLIQRGNTGSVPVQVTVTDLQPGIFTTAQTGQGQGAILVAGTTLVAGPAGPGQRPVKRGEYIEIYCTGLGQVQGTNGEAALGDGVAAPENGSPLYKTVSSASVTIGGVSSPMVSFSGLAPGFVGLYQVNAQVPDNAPAGDAVPVVLTMTGQNGAVSSLAVTVAVQ
jgi:uncharacterized protein (TIGR03437 family)